MWCTCSGGWYCGGRGDWVDWGGLDGGVLGIGVTTLVAVGAGVVVGVDIGGGAWVAIGITDVAGGDVAVGV